MMRGSAALVIGCLALLVPGGAAAQGRPALAERLDPQVLAELRPLLDAARRDSLPVTALEDKALEGTAKRIPAPRIVAAVRQLAVELKEARAELRGAAPGILPAAADVVAAAEARRRGVPTADVAALRRNVPPATALVVPLTVLADLVQRGVPVGEARSAIERLIAADVPLDQIAQLPARVDVALRVGAPPAQALLNALPIPLPPVPPTLPPPPRPGPPA